MNRSTGIGAPFFRNLQPLVLPGISQNFMTFYHDFEFVLLKTPFGEEPGFLNDTDIQMAVDFLSDLDFVAAE